MASSQVGRARAAGYFALGGLAPLWTASPGQARRLRVLAFHGVPNSDLFELQMKHVSESYTPLEPGAVQRYTVSGEAPTRSVWITFDDGDPSVVDVALPVLESHGLTATMFVCPGMVDTSEPYWWHVVELAASLGIVPHEQPMGTGSVPWLKTLPETRMRAVVSDLRDQVEQRTRVPVTSRQLTKSELTRWSRAGNDIQNHSWSHPVMPRSDTETQRREVLLAHDWLIENFPSDQKLFAYPNGDRSEYVHSMLAGMQYDGTLLFDHDTARWGDGFDRSRLRVNSTDPMGVFKAKISGVHPALHRVRRRG